MKIDKETLGIIVLNLLFSMLILYLSPRFDIVTLFWFIVLNIILTVLLKIKEHRKEQSIQSKIEEIFELLHKLDLDTENYEIVDDEFGKLRDEIVKIIVENKVVAKGASDNQQVLKEYTEDIAHQIKTPLTGALLLLDLMEEDQANAHQYIDYIRNSIERLQQLAETLLKMAALDSRTVELKREPVSILELVKKIKRDMAAYFIEEGATISIDGADFILTCDERWTYEAIYNIVKNGIEASPENRVEISLKESNLYQSVFVKDFSQGLDGDMLKKAYRRFYKENPNSKGYGIGLPMAKSIMEKQNGDLLYSKGKKSNTFELRFYK
ncbi:MAG: HAMP domain-containing histidine kinase [Eubacteriaceae bacterium]|jgi:signal transduction histidine kinase|nr:HAMP domain-containing histidine kinase [Eubacteriaceae bacterium]